MLQVGLFRLTSIVWQYRVAHCNVLCYNFSRIGFVDSAISFSLPVYLTAEGHEVIDARAEYRVQDVDQVLARLDEAEEFAYAGESGERPNAEHYFDTQTEQFQHEAPLVQNELMAREMENWLETPIPQLGNLAPREAAKTPEGRMNLIEILKTLEYLEGETGRDMGLLQSVQYGESWDSWANR
ncbi:MbcA/ParS/Xre antitoxin family protein [Chloroflexi bacterium TSY]|nr:MbcA/ParS/Xre antitoxin family protein [Chloroflexi bacterium TSY]